MHPLTEYAYALESVREEFDQMPHVDAAERFEEEENDARVALDDLITLVRKTIRDETE